MPEKYLPVEEVAALFPNLTPPALYSQRHRGENPGALGVKVGRRILWRESDLEAWFDSRKSESVPAV